MLRMARNAMYFKMKNRAFSNFFSLCRNLLAASRSSAGRMCISISKSETNSTFQNDNAPLLVEVSFLALLKRDHFSDSLKPFRHYGQRRFERSGLVYAQY